MGDVFSPVPVVLARSGFHQAGPHLTSVMALHADAALGKASANLMHQLKSHEVSNKIQGTNWREQMLNEHHSTLGELKGIYHKTSDLIPRIGKT